MRGGRGSRGRAGSAARAPPGPAPRLTQIRQRCRRARAARGGSDGPTGREERAPPAPPPLTFSGARFRNSRLMRFFISIAPPPAVPHWRGRVAESGREGRCGCGGRRECAGSGSGVAGAAPAAPLRRSSSTVNGRPHTAPP